MKKNLNEDSILFDDRRKDSKPSPLMTNIGDIFTKSGKTIARTSALILLSYLAWHGAAEFILAARNISEAIALVVVGALLYIFLVK